MMKNGVALILAALLILQIKGDISRLETRNFSVPNSRTQENTEALEHPKEFLAQLPLLFEENVGQADPEFKFIAHGSDFGLFLGSRDSVLEMRLPRVVASAPWNAYAGTSSTPGDAASGTVRVRLEGGNPRPRVSGTDEAPTRVNYFAGSDPKEWLTNVPVYSKVRYDAVYPGVDLMCYGNGQQLEYDFLVAPGADVSNIELAFDGVDKIELDSGDLLLRTAAGTVRQHHPVVYQRLGEIRHEVSGHYVLKDSHRVGFSIGHYDPDQLLVIDPVLEYSTYFGGSGDENFFARSDLNGAAIAVDLEGNAYLAGNTTSTDLQTANALQSGNAGGPDAFVAKLNAAGSALIYCTYLGGSGIDRAFDIAVDSSGNAYVTGRTQSPNFPIANALQPVLRGNEDAFVTKLFATGSELVYSTYLGGSVGDDGHSIAVDAERNIYVAGGTSSTDFPVLNALQPAYGGGIVDAFVAKLNPSRSALVYSSYLGGSGADHPEGIAVNALGEAYVAGQTTSTNFPTINQLDSTLGGGLDAFVARFNASGAALIYSTYLGGGGLDAASSIAVDLSGNACVVGLSDSIDFPTASPVQAVLGGNFDAFIAKLNPAGSSLVYSSYLGGSGEDIALGIAVDSGSNAFITGTTTSANFPSADPLQAAMNGVRDAFVTELNGAGSALICSTYFGGEDLDAGFGIAVDAGGSAYVIGRTSSAAFPTLNPLQASRGGGQVDAFVAKIAASVVLPDNAPKINGVVRSGKKLIVTGEKFDDGAILFMNGEKQKKTYNDELSPTTTLIANKSGKRIAPGETAILQVRNSDGKSSNEYSFTRPVQ